MNRTIIFTILGLLVTGIAGYFLFFHQSTPEPIDLSKGPLIAFGDSLVYGVGATDGNDFVSLLSARIGIPIENFGRSGDTTETALARISTITSEHPSLVIILLGGNDYLHKVPLDDTFKNLGVIVDTLQQNGATVLLIGVRGGLLRDTYEERFAQFAKEKDVAYVPNILDGLIGDERFMSDAVHPNNAGYMKVADKVEPTLKKLLGK